MANDNIDQIISILVVYCLSYQHDNTIKFSSRQVFLRGGSRERVQGVGGRGGEVEQETSAPPPKKNPGSATVSN